MEANIINTIELEKLADIIKQIEALEEERDAIKAMIMESMKAGQANKIDSEVITITYVAPTERKSFDTKRFEKENPEVYNSYLKVSPVSESLKIKVR